MGLRASKWLTVPAERDNISLLALNRICTRYSDCDLYIKCSASCLFGICSSYPYFCLPRTVADRFFLVCLYVCFNNSYIKDSFPALILSAMLKVLGLCLLRAYNISAWLHVVLHFELLCSPGIQIFEEMLN